MARVVCAVLSRAVSVAFLSLFTVPVYCDLSDLTFSVSSSRNPVSPDYKFDYPPFPLANPPLNLTGLNVFFLDTHTGTRREIALRLEELGIKYRADGVNNDDGATLIETLCPDPYGKRRASYHALAEDLRDFDVIICSHPTTLCEMFMPLNKSMLLLVTNMFEQGRENPARWAEWVGNMRQLQANPRHVVAANYKYAVQYVRYFTGGGPVYYLPPVHDYVPANASWAPKRVDLLFGRFPLFIHLLVRKVNQISESLGYGFHFREIREKYPFNHEYSDLSQHPAIVVVPYDAYVMSYGEYYAMGIPLFFPTFRFLMELDAEYEVLRERVLWSATPEVVPPPGDLPYNPNRFDRNATAFWFQFTEFYSRWPHLTYFDSWEELLRLLADADFRGTHRRMLEWHEDSKREAQDAWRATMEHFARQPRGVPPPDMDTGLRELFGQTLPAESPSCDRASRMRKQYDWRYTTVHVPVVVQKATPARRFELRVSADERRRGLALGMALSEIVRRELGDSLEGQVMRYVAEVDAATPPGVGLNFNSTIAEGSKEWLEFMTVREGDDLPAAAAAFARQHGLPEPEVAAATLVRRAEEYFGGKTAWDL